MKIRTDFVTNSSSSSFIIAYKRKDEKEDRMNRLFNMIVSEVLDRTGDWSDTEEAEPFRVEEWYDNDIIKKTKEYKENGYSVVTKEVSYNDNELRDFIEDLSLFGDDFIVLDVVN